MPTGVVHDPGERRHAGLVLGERLEDGSDRRVARRVVVGPGEVAGDAPP